MTSTMKVLLLLGLTIAMANCAVIKKEKKLPPGVECLSNSECKVGFCCMINHERYSYPTCRQLQSIGDFCRPGNPLKASGSRYYPDNTEIVLDNVHMQMCPCGADLFCDKGTCATTPKNFNHLDGQSDKRDD